MLHFIFSSLHPSLRSMSLSQLPLTILCFVLSSCSLTASLFSSSFILWSTLSPTFHLPFISLFSSSPPFVFSEPYRFSQFPFSFPTASSLPSFSPLFILLFPFHPPLSFLSSSFFFTHIIFLFSSSSFPSSLSPLPLSSLFYFSLLLPSTILWFIPPSFFLNILPFHFLILS